MSKDSTLIRWNEAMNLLRSSRNLLSLNQLLSYANYLVITRFQSEDSEELPVADFDLYFFLNTVRDFCLDQSYLKAVLDKSDDEADFSSLHSSFPEQMDKVRSSHLLWEKYKPFSAKKWEYYVGWKRNFYRCSGEALGIYPNKEIISEASIARIKKAFGFLYSSRHPLTDLLMHCAHYAFWNRFLSSRINTQPFGDFDLYFFLKAMEQFCDNHTFLRKVLNGEDLRWSSDDDDDEKSLTV